MLSLRIFHFPGIDLRQFFEPRLINQSRRSAGLLAETELQRQQIIELFSGKLDRSIIMYFLVLSLPACHQGHDMIVLFGMEQIFPKAERVVGFGCLVSRKSVPTPPLCTPWPPQYDERAPGQQRFEMLDVAGLVQLARRLQHAPAQLALHHAARRASPGIHITECERDAALPGATGRHRTGQRWMVRCERFWQFQR